MAFDAFLKLETIDGESTDLKHKDEIDVLSFQWGVDRLGTDGSLTSKVQADALVVEAHTSKASPELMLACCTGRHLPTGVLTVRKAGEKPLEYLSIKFEDIIVSSVSAGSQLTDPDAVPTDSVSINFSKIEYEYTEQNEDGSPGEKTRGAWDFSANKAF